MIMGRYESIRKIWRRHFVEIGLWYILQRYPASVIVIVNALCAWAYFTDVRGFMFIGVYVAFTLIDYVIVRRKVTHILHLINSNLANWELTVTREELLRIVGRK